VATEPSNDPAVEAISVALQGVEAEIDETPLGRRRSRLRAALALLTAGDESDGASGTAGIYTYPSPVLRATALGGVPGAPPSITNGTRPFTAKGIGGRSVKEMALSLMESQGRVWTYDDIMEEYQRRGTPIHGTQPKQALRTAVWELVKSGKVVSIEPGKFKAARFVSTGPGGMPR
jgi:hypothetical protein